MRPIIFSWSDAQSWKFVDDTTLAQVIPRERQSNIQDDVDAVEQLSRNNELF